MLPSLEVSYIHLARETLGAEVPFEDEAEAKPGERGDVRAQLCGYHRADGVHRHEITEVTGTRLADGIEVDGGKVHGIEQAASQPVLDEVLKKACLEIEVLPGNRNGERNIAMTLLECFVRKDVKSHCELNEKKSTMRFLSRIGIS